MDPVTNEEGGKPKVGSFVAGGGQAEQASQSSAGLPQDTLDERLEKVGEGRDDSLPDYLQEKNETITISPAPQTIEKIQGVPSISMSAPIPREDIVIPQEVPEVKEMPQEVRRAEEVRKVAEVSQEATVPAPLPQMEILPPATPPQETQPEVSRTVSGPPETV